MENRILEDYAICTSENRISELDNLQVGIQSTNMTYGINNMILGKIYLYYKKEVLKGIKNITKEEEKRINQIHFDDLEELITYVAVSEGGIYYEKVEDDKAYEEGVRRRKTKKFIAKKVTDIVRGLGEDVFANCDSLGKYCSKRQINKLIKFCADKSEKIPCYYAIILHVIFYHIELDKVISYKIREENRKRKNNNEVKMDEDEENTFKEKERKDYIDKMKGTLWFLKQINERFKNNSRATRGEIEYYAFWNVKNLYEYYNREEEKVCFASPYTEYRPLFKP